MRKTITAGALALAAMAPTTTVDAADGDFTFPCNQMTYQDWYGTVREDDTVTLVNKTTGRAVDDSSEFGLRAFDRNDGPAQRW
jgi:hypothetical protein